MTSWTSLKRSKIVWPLIALGVLLLFNLFFTPHFFRMEIKEGHLYGNLIDILKNGAPIMLLSIGMTLVIATHGIDISVGSVVAMSAGAVAILIGGDFGGHPKYPIIVAMIAALLVAELMSVKNKKLSELYDEYDKYKASQEINFIVEDKMDVMKKIEAEYKASADSVDWLDGVSIWFSDYWFNVRPSNTEPLLRLNVEADNSLLLEEKIKELVNKIESLGGKEKI